MRIAAHTLSNEFWFLFSVSGFFPSLKQKKNAKIGSRRRVILCVEKIGSRPCGILCIDKIRSRPRGIPCVDEIGSPEVLACVAALSLISNLKIDHSSIFKKEISNKTT